MGTPKFAVPILHELNKSSDKIVAVYSQPAQKAKRGQKLVISDIEELAQKLSLNIRTPTKLDDNEYSYLKSLHPDIVVVVAYGKIIPKFFLDLPKFGFINLHASLLPRWRGAAPIQRSIMNCDKETGVSFMKVQEKLDTGPYMLQIKTSINNEMNYKELSEKLSKLGAKNIVKCLDLIYKNKAKFINQDNSKASYANKIKKSEARIIWSESANKIIAKINGLNPFPGAWFEYKNSRFKLLKAKEVQKRSGEPGEVLNEKLTIACGKNALEVIEIQKEGKKVLKINEFLSGNFISKGTKLR